jgi:hypothetical protein
VIFALEQGLVIVQLSRIVVTTTVLSDTASKCHEERDKSRLKNSSRFLTPRSVVLLNYRFRCPDYRLDYELLPRFGQVLFAARIHPISRRIMVE